MKAALKGPPLCCRQSGSVSGVLSLDDHLSGTTVADGLKRAYPSVGRASLSRSYLPLLRVGFAKPPCCHDAGALLPHRFSFSPAELPPQGSLLFCGTFHRLTPPSR